MDYPKQFFEISVSFARKVAQVSRRPLDHALLHYTNLYIRFGLGRDFAAVNSAWQEYLEGVHSTEDCAEWTYRFYLTRQRQASSDLHESPFGCFSYTVVDGRRIRLHFHNNEFPHYSPLRRDRMGHRLAELRNMFAHIKHQAGDLTNVIGASWLYNLEAYCRLFPPAFLDTGQVRGNDFPYLPLWGQFLDHRGRMKEDLTTRFLESLDKQHRLEDMAQCFPFQVLYLESSVREFYRYYGV